LNIGIVRPAGREKDDRLQDKLERIRNRGHQVKIFDHPADPEWPYTSGRLRDRVDSFSKALLDPDLNVVWAVRGGYGCSDLLPRLDWGALKKAVPKTLVGFSDISALHSALWSLLGWRGIHGPMPGSALWNDELQPDVAATLSLLEINPGETNLAVENPDQRTFKGTLFGGCLSVLTNLIGTAYFPSSLRDAIVFIEDIDENPGRVIRNLQQWQLSGALAGAQCLILGSFQNSSLDDAPSRQRLQERIEEFISIPILHSNSFGHSTPNFPLGIGYDAVIIGKSLVWGTSYERHRLQQS
jgi:muramoyltetrapeptide carboxypeptidase